MKKKCRKSRKQLKQNYIEIKNAIRSSKDNCGGLFHSYHLLDGKNQWVDFDFLGKKERIVWNAEIITTKVAFHDLLEELAFEDLNNVLGDNWQEEYPSFIKKKTKGGFLLEPTNINIERLGNLTWFDWVNRRIKELADSNSHIIYESAKIYYSYTFGRGLHVIRHVENITKDVINEFIVEFIENGEQSYKRNDPVTFTSIEMIGTNLDVNEIK